jgi:MerR family transcriptional regulator, copper efflux regulator
VRACLELIAHVVYETPGAFTLTVGRLGSRALGIAWGFLFRHLLLWVQLFRYGRVRIAEVPGEVKVPEDASSACEPVSRLLQIGEVAERVGVSLRAVRYYEEQGLIVPETRTAGGFRLYCDDQIERLSLIKQMKPLGFTIDETRALLQARDVLHDPASGLAERGPATAKLREFAAIASNRCEELSLALDRASELARRLRREARSGGLSERI